MDEKEKRKLRGCMTCCGCAHFVNKYRNTVGFLGDEMLGIWSGAIEEQVKREEQMTMADWKRLDPTGKKLEGALDRAVEREYAMPVCPHWLCRRRGIRVIKDNLVVGRPYLCMACRNRYTEEEVRQ